VNTYSAWRPSCSKGQENRVIRAVSTFAVERQRRLQTTASLQDTKQDDRRYRQQTLLREG
jgi:hypothetical protein